MTSDKCLLLSVFLLKNEEVGCHGLLDASSPDI